MVDDNRIICSSAVEFMEKLNSWNDFWNGPPTAPGRTPGNEWVFRGHGDSRWRLIGTSLRKRPEEIRGSVEMGGRYVSAVAANEFLGVRAFYEKCVRYGLQVPELAVSYFNQYGLSDLLAKSRPVHGDLAPCVQAFPDPRLWEMMAIARHYGLPVRFVDWTIDSRVAAYFAAADAAKPKEGCKIGERKSEQFMDVWGINITRVHKFFVDHYDDYVGQGSLPRGRVPAVIQFVSVPAHRNPNQLAQRGSFTVVRYPDSSVDSMMDPSLQTIEDVVEAHIQSGVAAAKHWLRRVSLPICFAPEVLQMLGESGVGAASIYPGYRGVVAEIQEEELWYAGPTDKS